MVNFYLHVKKSLTLLLVISRTFAFSQEKQATGTVTADGNGLLPGVSVVVMGYFLMVYV